jgi:hypothetical protein
MTKDEAIEKCIKVMVKRQHPASDHHDWRQKVTPRHLDLAENIIACLEALEILRPT